MARIGFFLLFFFALPVLVYPKPRHYSPPTPTPTPETGPSRQDLFKTVDHIVQLSQDLQKNLDAEKAAHEHTEITLQKANAENADLQKRIDKNTRECNATADKYAGALKKLWWYRVHFFLGWVLFATGILAGATIWILKITGKLGVMAAKL